MLWMTMHWTLFTEPGWHVQACATPQCALAGGGNYAVLASEEDTTIIVETFTHSTSKCIRHDPADWAVDPQQTVTIAVPTHLRAVSTTEAKRLQVFRSCSSWRYPADDDGYMLRLDDITATADGSITFVADRDCYYTLTTVTGRAKPKLSATSKPSAAFQLPYREDFEGSTVGGEAPFFGDQVSGLTRD